MITKLNVTSIYVLDKDEALDFYVNKLGLEKGNDVRQGDYRWLTVRVPGAAGAEISLEQPGAPLHDPCLTNRRPYIKGASSAARISRAGLLGNRLTVDPRTLTPLVLVRIQVPQPTIPAVFLTPTFPT